MREKRNAYKIFVSLVRGKLSLLRLKKLAQDRDQCWA